MKEFLSVAYITNRREPHIEWFFDSLANECVNVFMGIKCIVVDFYAEEPARKDRFRTLAPAGMELTHVGPKPTVWQGKHRLTSADYFAASNARNTALCLAPDGWIAYVDDVSVLLPGWLSSVQEAMEGNYVALGTYKKVLALLVKKGKVEAFRELPAGLDSRWNWGSDEHAVPAGGGSMFGCSVAGPVEAFLTVNGWDEDCDSMGSEDYICGLMLEKAGYSLRYDRRMMTLESEEDHHKEAPFKRIIKHEPSDASYAMLNMVLQGNRMTAPNYFGPEGVRGLRQSILSGGIFPNMGIPEHDWRDGRSLREM